MGNEALNALAWLATIIIAIALIYFVIKYSQENSRENKSGVNSDEDILAGWYNSGKLSKEEYERLKTKLR